MGFYKLVVVSFATLLLMASHVPAKMKPPIDRDQLVNVHQVSGDETLWRVATDNTIEGASVWQTLMSLYQLNLHAFVKKDISRLRTDSILVMPTIYQAISLSPEAAKLTYEKLIASHTAPLDSADMFLPAAHIIKAPEPLEPKAQKVETKTAPKEAGKVRANSTTPVTSGAAGKTEQIILKKAEVPVAPPQKITPPKKSIMAPAKSTFILKKVIITGSESFSAETLHALIADSEGAAQDITQLSLLTDNITQFYQDQGFSIARAILPAQRISQGNVSIQVIEPKYGQINLTNNSGVSDALLAATAAPMQPGKVISDASMYTSILLFSDIPGLAVSSRLSPGSKVGSSDVTLVIEDSQTYSGSLTVDQYGDVYTGKQRITGSMAINNLAGHGDVVTVSGMFSSADMQFGSLAYDWLLSGDGTHLGAAYSGLYYRLGEEIAITQMNGATRTGSVWIKHPVLRSLVANSSIQLQYDVNQLRDHIDSVSLFTDRTISTASLTVAGDQQNTYSLGGTSSWSFGLKSGDLSFDNSAAEIADASSANTKGHFEKINISVNHVQSISNKASVDLNVSGQWASHNLDASEKLSAGGPSTVRAYNSGALSGDAGYIGSAAFRYYLTQAFDGRLTGSLFYDSAHIIVNKSPWQGLTSDNSATISGAGIGLDWAGPKQLSANLVIAVPTDSTSTLVDDRPTRSVWLSMNKGF